MTLQDIFDKAARHLLTQGRKSIRADTLTQCAYRGANGTQCAVGPFIADEYYHKSLDYDLCVSHPLVTEALEKSGFPIRDAAAFRLLMSLQRIHDGTAPKHWRNELAELASRLDLSTAVLEEFPA